MDSARQWWAGLKGLEKVVALVLPALLAAFVISVGSGMLGGGPDEPRERTDHARDACHEQVEARLKAPATADFTDTAQTGGKRGPWTFSGYVDSENSFGAKVRARWSCEARLSGEDVIATATVRG